jgi:hypothetical protein
MYDKTQITRRNTNTTVREVAYQPEISTSNCSTCFGEESTANLLQVLPYRPTASAQLERRVVDRCQISGESGGGVGGASSPRGLFLPEVKLDDRRWVGGTKCQRREKEESDGERCTERSVLQSSVSNGSLKCDAV